MISARGTGLAIAGVLAAMPAPGTAKEVRFDVPAQAAVTGIPLFARQAGIQIVAPVSGLDNQRTREVRGRYHVDEALAILLRGTGLRVAARSGTIYSLTFARIQAEPPARKTLPVPSPRPVPPVPPPQDIIVTGTREGLSPSPQDEKQGAIAFVTSVGSREMQQRADTSVAAATLRLPGVVLSRGTQTAQAWYPAIRGFDGKYSSVTLDGSMLYLSTRNQRGVPLDFLPTAAINQIVVYKTVTPDMDPNSIGGHMDIRTLGAFDDGGRALTRMDGQLAHYAQSGAGGATGTPSYAINAVAKRTFGPDGNFGFVLVASGHRDRFSETVNSTTGFVQQNGVDVPSGNLLTGRYERRQYGTSLLGKLEGRGGNWHAHLSANTFEEHIRQDLWRSSLSILPMQVTNAAHSTGDFTGAIPSASANAYYNDRSIVSVRAGGELQVSTVSKLVLNASWLHVDYREQLLTGAPIAGPSVSGSYSIDDRTAGTSITGPASLADPARWVQATGSVATRPVWPHSDDIYTARLAYTANAFAFSNGLGVDAGVDFRRLSRVLDQTTFHYSLPEGARIDLGQVLLPGSAFAGQDMSRPIRIDTRHYWDLIARQGIVTVDPGLVSDYRLREDVVAPYLSVHYTSDAFRLLGGVRYNVVRYANSTHHLEGGVPLPFHIKRSLPYVLPNIQGFYEFADALRVRAAATRTIALQDFNNFAMGLAPGNDYRGNPVINVANPWLKPRRSDNLDLALEAYAPSGYASLGYFRKRVTDEVQVITEYRHDAQGGLIEIVQTPINAGSERVQGIELDAQWRDFTPVAQWLDGLTLDVNGAWFDTLSRVVITEGPQRTIRGLRLQPRWVANVILTYQRGPVTGSIMAMTRGRALNSVATTPAADTYIAPYSTLDAKLSYRLSPRIRIRAEGRNLTDHWYREVTGLHSDLVSTAIRPGRTFVLGVSISL